MFAAMAVTSNPLSRSPRPLLTPSWLCYSEDGFPAEHANDIMGRGFAIAFFLAVSVVLSRRGSSLTIGGPSSFGYDASSACGKPLSRAARTRLQNLPCDFRYENWCTVAGNAYPWQAVRRFVHENQGLMKRMYGDEKHISVLQTELKKNDIEMELENDNGHHYAEYSSSFFRPFYSEVDYGIDGTKLSNVEDRSANREHQARSMNNGMSNSDEAHRSFTTENPTASTAIPPSSSMFFTTWMTSQSSSTPSSTTEKTPPSHKRVGHIESTTHRSQMNISGLEVDGGVALKTPIINHSYVSQIQNLRINEIPGKIDRLDIDVDELTEIPEIETSTTLESQKDGIGIEISTARVVSSSSERMDDSKIVFNDYDFKSEESGNDDEQQQQQQQQPQFRPRPEYKPPDSSNFETTEAVKEQLFQDAASKDKQDTLVLKVRGINACPVKEEVVAPFWANSTRGEVLALLNLYPFEQYVHWEKCTDEKKQMYCRDGCRCEQQYRLHRLLAYDPNNECRGIFSDWFKFPSCCICRCYDLPLEFRVTSRSPRVFHQRKLKVRAPRPPPRESPIPHV